MKIKFFADDHNARFIWSWENGAYETEDQEEIDNLKGIGLRFEEQESPTVKRVKAEEEVVKLKAKEKKSKANKKKA